MDRESLYGVGHAVQREAEQTQQASAAPVTGADPTRTKGIFNAMSTPATQMMWIGWAGLNDPQPTEEVALRAELETRDCVPVMLREDSCAAYFDGMCNDVLWPLLHSAEPGLGDRSLHGHERQWRAYVEANRAYAAEVLDAYQPGDVVFVHDYHLMLVPQLLRAAVGPSMRIGWFLHVSSSLSHDAK